MHVNRSKQTQAIILDIRPVGENNSNITLFTEKEGIIYATLYGGAKSKLKSLVSLWNTGNIYLYENPEKNQIKITDFDVKNYHEDISKSLYKSFAVSLVAEIIIKTKANGSNTIIWNLVNGFLDGLSIVSENQAPMGLMRFLWRYLDLMGLQPDAVHCGLCGKSFSDISPTTPSFYYTYENHFICSDCSYNAEKNFSIKIDTSVVQYLGGISTLNISQARKLTLDERNFLQLRQLLFFLIENSIESKLNTLTAGAGIL